MHERTDREQLLDDLMELDTRWAREDLLEFIQEMSPKFIVNFHHEIICRRLTQLVHQTGQRLIINVPPQYGKSEIVSRYFPAWVLGKRPDSQIILSSYAADLANSFNRDCQAIMESEDYARIFSETLIYPSVKKKRTQNFVETSESGYLFSVGVGGSTTGRTANPLFIIDDPIKDLSEALSESHRKRVLDWYLAVAQTRLSLKANVIIMHTRWHEDDLAGALLKKGLDDAMATQWEHINIPAIVDDEDELHIEDPRFEGEALWPEVKGGPEVQARIKRDVGSFIWSAMFQGKPVADGGNMIESSWWRYYRTLPEDLDQWIVSVDAAFKDLKTSDYVVMQVWARSGANKYIVDQIRGKMNVMKTEEMIIHLVLKYTQVSSVLIEEKANGAAVIQRLKGKVSRLIAVNPTESKISRLAAVSPQIEGGNVFLPHESITPFDIGVFISEFSAFPHGRNDDQVDAATQALTRLSAGENHYLRRMLGGS